MAVEGIKITLNEVSSTANQIRSLNQNLTSVLAEVKQEMNALSAVWQSDASETIRAKFNNLQPTFDNFREVVDNYAKFLDQTVTTYNDTESQINNNASAFK